ncbi:hypothetical protein [Spirilliplanes yamanashiensis]|uniref:Uncharacterized protein n=1 Tax=Spirilliplanes yamanashiensis TaxID=42233 RepID=A0A8J3Y7C9_9ACTN|nr:hypothetical protein [Spirilliplanes yamanashiensis]MDP9817179.1 hypothetical protein [Spirilliplanes yamanashiensis]GIJ03168.1 hypothetical protein Sya03_25200 [Spirilliplanes yamanashiensis]
MTAARPCRPTGRRPRPGYRSSRLVRYRRVRLTADVSGGAPPPGRPFPGGLGAHPAPARTAPEAWTSGRHRTGAAAPERGERGGLIAFALVVLVLLAASLVGGVYLWRRHNDPPVASPAACAVAAETLAQGRALTADPGAAGVWRADREAAHLHIQEPYLYDQVGRYAWYATRIATGEAHPPTAEELAAVERALPAHCRAELTVTWPPAPSAP